MQAHKTTAWALSEPEVIAIHGRLDSGTAPHTEDSIMQRITSGAHDLILDCTHTTFMTGAGLRMILTVAHEMQKVGVQFAVCNVQAQAKQMFDACNYENIIPVFSDREKAIAALAA